MGWKNEKDALFSSMFKICGMEKTNVSRLLDAAHIEYEMKEYSPEVTDGEEVAKRLNEDPDCVFKTLVCENQSKEHFVFCIPVNHELDLKKAAKAVGAKSIALIHQKELLPLTGYVHGGCSPIGMKKHFATAIDETALLFDFIYVSAGKKGFQIKLNPLELIKYCEAKEFDLTK